LTKECRQAELAGPAAGSLYLISLLSQYSNDLATAETTILESTEASRVGDPMSLAAPLANGGRCLAHLGREFDRAEAMLREAEELANRAGVALSEIPFGIGLIRAHDGDLDQAKEHLARALEMMRSSGDHWRACECMSRLVLIELERGRLEDALKRCGEFRELANKMGEGSEAPFAFALQSLVEWRSGDSTAEDRVMAGLALLRNLDSKSLLAEGLILAAETHLGAGRLAPAQSMLAEALGNAQAVQRRSEVVLSLALLADTALASRNPREAERRLEQAQGLLAAPREISARARAALYRAWRSLEDLRTRPNQEATQ
jgi:tetratricopeptide (TPR) repeat protein